MAWTSKWQNTFNCGTNGTTVSPANTGGTCGTALSRILSTDIGTGNTAIFSSAWSFVDGLCLRMTQAGANRNQAYIALDGTYGDIVLGYGLHWLANPSVACQHVRLYTDTAYGTAGGVAALDLILNVDGGIYVTDNVAVVSSSNSTGKMTPGNAYWYSFRYQASTNSAVFRTYDKAVGGTIKSESILTVATDVAIGSLTFGIGTPSTGLTLDWDNIEIGTGGDAPRPDIANSAPVISVVGAAARSVPVGSTVSDLSFTATDQSTVYALSAAVTTRPAGSSLPTVTGLPTGLNTGAAALTGAATFGSLGTYVVSATAVDDGTPPLSSTITVTVDTYPPQDTPTWIRVVQPGTDVQYGTESDLTKALTDQNSTTGMETAPAPSGAVRWIQTGALPPTGISARVIGFRNGAGTLRVHVELYKTDKVTKVWETKPSPGVGETADLTFGGVNETQTISIDSAGLSQIALTPERTALWWKLVSTVS